MLHMTRPQMRLLFRRRRLSMTSMINVFLLFFMLTSTFTRFTGVELASGGGGTGLSDASPIFAQPVPESHPAQWQFDGSAR